MTVMYWAIIVIGCLAIGFLVGKFATQVECAKMLYTFEVAGYLKFPEEHEDDALGE